MKIIEGKLVKNNSIVQLMLILMWTQINIMMSKIHFLKLIDKINKNLH